MRGLDYTAAATGTAEEREEADWAAKRLDMVLWEPEDYPEQWAGFIPGLPLEQVGGEWLSPSWCAELLVFRFARVTEQVERDVGTPVHYLKPAVAGRCLQQARAVRCWASSCAVGS